MMPSRERIAHHEAGHAVIQALLARGRFTVAEVSIRSGATCVVEHFLQQGRALLDREAELNLYEFGLATLAGIAAENRYFEDHPPSDSERLWGATGDIEEWESACSRLYPDERKMQLVGLNVMRRLGEFYHDPVVWGVVQDLAAALQRDETVAGDELAGVLAKLEGVLKG